MYIISSKYIEGFTNNVKGIHNESEENSVDFSKEFIKAYNDFTSFYNTFIVNWQKAIVSSIVADIPQEPLKSPKDVASLNGQAQQPTKAEMNIYINKLSEQLQQELPPITAPFPNINTLNLSNLSKIQNEVPKNAESYINALTWMNKHLNTSHANLEGALQGQPSTLEEAFQDVCQNIATCIQNNPDILKQIENAQKEQEHTNSIALQNQLIKQFQVFTTNTNLLSAINTNTELIKKSEDIQNQAQSGELINKINIPGSKTEPPKKYIIPDGGDTLTKMKNSDPDKYKELQTSGKQWFSLKQLIEQINGAL
jgi:hypothetical protein